MTKPGTYVVGDLTVALNVDKKDKKLGAIAGNGKWTVSVSSRVLLAKESNDLPIPDDLDLEAVVRRLAPCLVLLKTPYREKRAYLSYDSVKLFWFDSWVSTTSKFAECSLLTRDELTRLGEWMAGQQVSEKEVPDEEDAI